MEEPVRLHIALRAGGLTCTPTVLHAKRNQTILFTPEKFPFLIQIKGISPLDAAEIWSDGEAPAVARVRDDADLGVYSFACAICDPQTGRIFLDAGCPSIIIDR